MPREDLEYCSTKTEVVEKHMWVVQGVKRDSISEVRCAVRVTDGQVWGKVLSVNGGPYLWTCGQRTDSKTTKRLDQEIRPRD